MNSNVSPKNKYKRPKRKTKSTTDPAVNRELRPDDNVKTKITRCPLLAKDSEWIDVITQPVTQINTTAVKEDDEEGVLQLVDCEDGPELRPLAIMFPALLEKDPETLQEMLNKVMSTTEVTKHLVNLRQKANFKSMNKTTRLIPQDKKWLESLAENPNSRCSNSDITMGIYSMLSDYDADTESDGETRGKPIKAKKSRKRLSPPQVVDSDTTVETFCTTAQGKFEAKSLSQIESQYNNKNNETLIDKRKSLASSKNKQLKNKKSSTSKEKGKE